MAQKNLLKQLVINEREFKRKLFNDRVEKNYLRLYLQGKTKNLPPRPQSEIVKARENVEKVMPKIVDKSKLKCNFNKVISHLRKSSLSSILPVTNIEALETRKRPKLHATRYQKQFYLTQKNINLIDD